MRLVLLTLMALVAFAANSILCRLALRHGEIDPVSFTAIRIAAGAIVLVALVWLRGIAIGGNWPSSLALLAYAIGFSLAYVALPAGIGALMLFGAVQVTMIGTGLVNGERPQAHEWIGEGLSIIGLIALLLPGATAPPLGGSLLMLGAGIAWAVYSLRGRRGGDPTGATAGNFLRATPLALLPIALQPQLHASATGVMFAVLSGAVASGLGYAVWYTVLPKLTAMRAGLVQIAVPVLVALVGIGLLGEPPSLRLLLCALLILGGLALATLYRPASRRPPRAAASTR